jgi:hypothetical protein
MTDPYLLAVVAFVAGTAFGWVLASARAKTSDFTLPAEIASAAGAGRSRLAKARIMEIKCPCGSLLKFRDPVEPGYQPFPNDDSIACANCGRVMKLSEIRRPLKDAQG